MRSPGVAAVALETLIFVPIAAFLGSPLGTRLTKSPEMLGVPGSVISSPKHLTLLVCVPFVVLIPDVLEAAYGLVKRPWRAIEADLQSECSDAESVESE